MRKFVKPKDSMKNQRFIFFGTPEFSVTIAETLRKNGYVPDVVVSAPDRKVGRKQLLTAPPLAQWAKEHQIPLLQPEHPSDITEILQQKTYDFFVVAAYGYILRKEILDIPIRGTLNVHTSLLPRWRGACPIESVILARDLRTGSTIMLMDEKLDHGPILAQESFSLDQNTNRENLFEILAVHGAELLVTTLPQWINGEISGHEQNHSEATFCKKIEKQDGDITNDDDYTRYRKFLGYYGWPGVFFIDQHHKRVKITDAQYLDGVFVIQKVIPEGKNEMDYEQYLKSSNKK